MWLRAILALSLLSLGHALEESHEDPKLIGWHGESFHPQKVFGKPAPVEEGQDAQLEDAETNAEPGLPKLEVVTWKPRVFK